MKTIAEINKLFSDSFNRQESEVPKGKRIILNCDCADWKRCWGITLDSQDIAELRYTSCPYCKKPFELK